MIHLGAFELDPATAELSRAGRRVHLPSQSARLLLLLASRAPEVVSREDIRHALWGEDLHVEFDAAVNACISQIRSVLGDSARAPRFIETIPRQGYRCLVEQASRPAGHPTFAVARWAGRPSGQQAPCRDHAGAGDRAGGGDDRIVMERRRPGTREGVVEPCRNREIRAGDLRPRRRQPW